MVQIMSKSGPRYVLLRSHPTTQLKLFDILLNRASCYDFKNDDNCVYPPPISATYVKSVETSKLTILKFTRAVKAFNLKIMDPKNS